MFGLFKSENKNSPAIEEKYLSPIEIVSSIVSGLSEKEMEDIAEAYNDELDLKEPLGGFFAGMNLRNHYKMWHEDNPYFEIKNPTVGKHSQWGDCELTIDALFPDNASGVIKDMVVLECKAQVRKRNEFQRSPY